MSFGIEALTDSGKKVINENAKSFLFKAKITTGILPAPLYSAARNTTPVFVNTGVPSTSRPPMVFTECKVMGDKDNPSMLGIYAINGTWQAAYLGPIHWSGFLQLDVRSAFATVYIFEAIDLAGDFGHGLSIYDESGDITFSTADDRKPLFIRHTASASFDTRDVFSGGQYIGLPQDGYVALASMPSGIIKPCVAQPCPYYGYNAGGLCSSSRTTAIAAGSSSYQFDSVANTLGVVARRGSAACSYNLPAVFWLTGDLIIMDGSEYD
jgi:hypothetical protein